MTTAYGSTTSSPDTPQMLSLEEAPFWRYLEILREEGYQEDADFSELFYVDLLTTVQGMDGIKYTKEQVMKTPFKNLVKAVELMLEEVNREMPELPKPAAMPGGTALVGSGADSLSEADLQRIMMMQSTLHEQNKIDRAVT